VNGEQTRLAEGIHVVELLDRLGLKPERLAVEVNRRIIRRAEWASTALAEGDNVEIVHFVGGGCRCFDDSDSERGFSPTHSSRIRSPGIGSLE
jgi:thiamine biosynthesis protein ThiS